MFDISRDGEAHQGALRLFFVDEKTGDPVAGVTFSILADALRFTEKGAEPPPDVELLKDAGSPDFAPPLEEAESLRSQTLLAAMQTDQAGYASFKFDRSLVSASSRLTVTWGASEKAALSVNVADVLAGQDAFTIRFNPSELPPGAPDRGLPAVMSPDARDLLLSPRSIGLIPYLLPGGGLCRQLMPTTLGVRRFRAIHVLADICEPEVVTCKEPVRIVRGKLLEYEIAWHPAGTSLGDLLNTITLAPCEQVNIAIADWMRQETTLLNQATDVRQESFQQTNHDRLIVETMDSSVKNKGSAWAIGGTVGKSTGGKIGGTIEGITGSLTKDITAAFGGGFSSSTSTQQIALNTSSQLSDRIVQAASSVASQRSSVVFQAAASEHQTYQTRSVRNHNHCHTLTLMYYQVNRGYRVVTDYKGSRDVLLIRCDNADFTARRAYDHLDLLKDALLDPALLPAFDELADALFCCNIAPPVKEWLMDSLTMTFWIQENNGNVWWFNGVLNLTQGAAQHFGGGVAFPLQTWRPGEMRTVDIPLANPIDPEEAVSIVLNLAANPTMPSLLVLSKIEVTGHVVGLTDPITLYQSQGETTINSVSSPSWLGWLDAELPEQHEDVNECLEKSCGIRKLLGHLNAHKRYYNTILCFNEDPNERVLRWSCCRRDETPLNLIDQIENTPVTVYGDYVVFPAAGSQLVDDPSIHPVSKLVMIPTPGVFAEGILGQCNTCETIDTDVFWNWKDSPCSDSAPAVAPPPAPQPTAKPSDLKTEAITNLIEFTNVPSAPDSMIKDLISSLVSKADSGSNEAKELLGKLLDTIKESIPKPKA